MKTIIKENIVYILLFAIIIALSGYIYYITNRTHNAVCDIVEHKEGLYTKIQSDKEIAFLKKENRQLYDSVKTFKEQITFLAQFKYEKEYNIDTVKLKKPELTDSTKVFEYCNNANDSITYKLKIGATKEPNWYALNIKISDKFTIVNKNIGGMNETNIKTDNKADVSEVIIYNKPRKKTFFQHFNAGPGIMVGYDMVNKNIGVMAGFSVTYTIW